MPRDTPNPCPHCNEPLSERMPSGHMLRCGRCGFVVPGPNPIVGHPAQRDHRVLPVDRYRLLAPMRSRGCGRVYLARHLLLDEPCVVKVLGTDDPGYSPEACRRFMDEARAGFRIRHGNVARVLDCGYGEDALYFVMEFVDGVDLAEVVRTCGRLPWAQVADIGEQTVAGLAAIHASDLLHRDIKPSNLILCTDGSVKIADLGLVRMTDSEPRAGCHSGFGLGTPQYMAPEQRGDGALDDRTDLYSLGATLFHLLTGRTPLVGQGPLDYLTGGDRRAPVEWPNDVVPPVPSWLRRVIETCLAPDPDHRFADAAELLRQIHSWLERADAGSRAVKMPGVGAPKGVVVLPFRNLSADASDDWMGNAVAEDVQNTLLAINGVQVVDRHELLALLGRMYAEQPGLTSDAQILDAARRIGAAVVVRGSFQRMDHRVKLSASALDDAHEGGRLLASATGAYADILDLQARIGRDIAEQLGYSAVPPAADPDADALSNRRIAKHYAKGQSAYASGKYAAAIEECATGLERAPGSVELLSLKGVCHSRLGQYDDAIDCHRRLEQVARDKDDPYRLVEAIGNLGVMHYFKGDYARAHVLLEESGRLAADLNLLPLLAKTCNNSGFALAKLERLTEADAAFEESIRLKLSLGATASLISPYNGRGEIAVRQGRYHDALRFYGQALAWARELKDHVNIGICTLNIGRCHADMGDQTAAEQQFTQALNELTNTEFWLGVNAAYERLADLHLARHESEPAFDCIEKRIDLARRHKHVLTEAAAWEQKARAYELCDQKDTAMECLRKSIDLQRSHSPYEPLNTPDTGSDGPRTRRPSADYS